MTIVQGLIASYVRYFITVYGNVSAANDARLLEVVNFATRVIRGLRKYNHESRARVDLGLYTPRQMCDIQSVIVAHKACVLSDPDKLAGLRRIKSQPFRQLRSSECIGKWVRATPTT